jgi:Zn-dependent M28 family amino/carboxypeptidase
MKKSIRIIASAGLLSLAWPAGAADDANKLPQASLRAISPASFVANIRTLASDDFEGRGPGSGGEAKTIAFLQQQFAAAGLKPGNPNGSYLQPVPVVASVSAPRLSYKIGAKTVQLHYPDDYVAFSSRPQADTRIDNSELVFVGYGIVAPEYGWDDYKGVDVRGKTIVMLINDPPIPDPADPARLDPAMFKGNGMTYYGRWTYKWEIAAKMGAAAAIIVHETKPAAYPWEVVRKGNTGEQYALHMDGPNPAYPPVPAWIQLDRAKELMAAGGHDFDKLKLAARSKDFRPVSLGGSASIHIASTARDLNTHNVVGMVEGSDPVLKHEYVIYSAHWDHFGIDEKLPGPKAKQVFHGALDNASGTAALVELAKAYKALPVPPKRSILFIATTLEERGLLGARYYAAHPLYPLEKTLLNINIDNMNGWGRTAQIENVTSGHSSVDAILAKYARTQGRVAADDSRPDVGSFYRADQIEFALVGVPALYTKSRSKYLGRPDGYAAEKVDAYYANDYHKVSDTLEPGLNFDGAIEDIGLLFLVGYDVAQGAVWPEWNAGSEFKAKRDAMLKVQRK